MSDKHESGELHELAGGWISERKGTPIPAFLKLTYVGFCAFGIFYLFSYWSGEVAHETRGPLVRQVNAVMQVPTAGWLTVIAACLALFTAGLLWFAFVHRSEE